MTEVEAVEVILKGPAWVTCPDCEGSGLIAIPSSMTGLRQCDSCDSRGKLLPADYVEACDIVGKEYPVYEKPGLTLTIPTSQEFVINGIYNPDATKRLQISVPKGVTLQGGTLNPDNTVTLVYDDNRWVADREPDDD